MKRGIVFALYLVFISFFSYGQNQNAEILLFGQLTNLNEEALKNAHIFIFADSIASDTIQTNGLGRFEAPLEYGFNYFVHFGYVGYVSKIVQIDTRNVPERRQEVLGFELDVSLFNEDGLDYSMLNEPIGIARYNKRERVIAFDKKYTKNFQKRLMQLRGEEVEEEGWEDEIEEDNE